MRFRLAEKPLEVRERKEEKRRERREVETEQRKEFGPAKQEKLLSHSSSPKAYQEQK